MSSINEALREASKYRNKEDSTMYEKPKMAANTIIGKSITIKGKLKGDEDLIVKGRVDADITSTKSLMIENSGVVKADVKVKSIQIHGVLVGSITAEDQVEIAPNGRVVGNIQSPRVIMHDGAAIRGMVDMNTAEPVQHQTPERTNEEETSPTLDSYVSMPKESALSTATEVNGDQSSVEDAVFGG
jgi:cytoskeletal protein CcmA (bactofilin family)